MSHEAAAREIVPVPQLDTTAADGFVRRMAIEAIAKADERRKEVVAILRKHFPTWQPIESAPKDGTPVLLAEKSGAIDCRHFKHGVWVVHVASAGQPTHWQPLPPPPGVEP